MKNHREISQTKLISTGEDNKEKKSFTNRIARLSAIACNLPKNEDFDINEAEKVSHNELKALEVKGGLQEMLAAQMLSIHQLQQISIAMAGTTLNTPGAAYFINTTAKLANVFVQQANLLNKLQGNGEQKYIVERVNVHKGGQAVVGNIHNVQPETIK